MCYTLGSFIRGGSAPRTICDRKDTLLSEALKRYPFRAEPPHPSTLPLPPWCYTNVQNPGGIRLADPG